jgi:Fe-S-cluster-containing dehydrogenase component
MENQTRRNFVKTLGTAGVGLAAAAPEASAATSHLPDNSQLSMLYDATKCVGCKACMAACKRVNTATGALAFEQAPFDPDAIWDAPKDLSGDTRTVIKLGRQDAAHWSYIKYSCMHCQKPSCVSVCPVKAMNKDPETGIIYYKKNTCIGCRYCQIACPFNIPKFQWNRSIPQIVKCDFCRETNLKEKGIPACVEVCPTGALSYGKRAAMLQEAHRRLEQNPKRYVPHVFGEEEVGGTNYLYVAGVPFDSLGLPKLPDHAPAELSEKIQHTIYKGCIAPVALFAALCVAAVRNQKHSDPSHDAHAQPGKDQ